MRVVIALCLALFFVACSERTTAPPPGATAVKSYPAHGKQVRIVRSDLPPGSSYEVLAALKAIEGGYGELATAERKLADDARAIGADAVINVKVWHAPRFGAWAAPHAEGVAVKITKPESVNLDQVPGNWY